MRLTLPVLVVACFLALTGQAYAGTQRIWTGAAGTGLWSTAGNWSNGVPVAGDGVSITAPGVSTDDVGVTINDILFTSTAGGATINGSVTINASAATINIESDSDDNRISAAIAITGSTLFVKSATAGQQLTLAGVISGTANLGVRIYGPGTVEYAQSSNNTYPGTTTVASADTNGGAGTLLLSSPSAGSLIPADLMIGGTNSGQPADSARVRLLTLDDIASTSVVTVNHDGLLDLNGLNESFASLQVTGGDVNQGAGNLTVANQVGLSGGSITSTTGALVLTSTSSITSSGTPVVITAPIRIGALVPFTLPISVAAATPQPELTLGPISATNGTAISVSKTGSGELRLNGESTYTGSTAVTAGTLSLASGSSLSSSAVSVASGAALRGLGTSGVVTVTGGTFAPGITGTPGAYAVTGGLTLGSSSVFDVNAADGGVGTASATGTITLGNATLHVTTAPGYLAPAHAKFRIVDNLGANPVNGTFAGLPEGAPVVVGGKLLTLSYKSGTGNDVELALPNTAPVLASGASVSPSPGAATVPVTFAAAAADADGDALTYTWSFGDGATGTGAVTTHTYTAPGQYAVSVAISDGFGGSLSSATTETVGAAPPTKGPPNLSPPPVPVLTHFAQTHAKWRAGKALAVFAKTTKKQRPPVGTQLSFTLDQAATVALVFTRCPTKGCKHPQTLGTVKHAARSGKSKVKFQARISATKKLKPGRYTVTATATTATGHSKSSSLNFTIVP